MGRYRQKMMCTIRSNVERSLSDYCIHTMTREIKTISITSWNDHLFFTCLTINNDIRYAAVCFFFFFLFVQSADDKTRPCVCNWYLYSRQPAISISYIVFVIVCFLLLLRYILLHLSVAGQTLYKSVTTALTPTSHYHKNKEIKKKR